MKFDPRKHHRRSIRLTGYDYAQPGAYFITVATHERECLFGEVVNGEMLLSHMGQVAAECWTAIPEHFPQAAIGAYVVMPNHVHGIIVIGDEGRGTPWRAPTKTESFGKPVGGSLATIVRQYKSSVTRGIRKEMNVGEGRPTIWQRNYYEHIVRNEAELQQIVDYIEVNPLRWEADSINPES